MKPSGASLLEVMVGGTLLAGFVVMITLLLQENLLRYQKSQQSQWAAQHLDAWLLELKSYDWDSDRLQGSQQKKLFFQRQPITLSWDVTSTSPMLKDVQLQLQSADGTPIFSWNTTLIKRQ